MAKVCDVWNVWSECKEGLNSFHELGDERGVVDGFKNSGAPTCQPKYIWNSSISTDELKISKRKTCKGVICNTWDPIKLACRVSIFEAHISFEG